MPPAVTGYVLEHAAAADSVWSAKAQVTALRSLLRFLHVHGWIGSPLAGAARLPRRTLTPSPVMPHAQVANPYHHNDPADAA
jgi:hypothetical protein